MSDLSTSLLVVKSDKKSILKENKGSDMKELKT